jgi:hypothetical protein
MAQAGDFSNDDYVPPRDPHAKAVRLASIQARTGQNRVVARPRGESPEEWMSRAVRMSRFWIDEILTIPLKQDDKGYAAQQDFLRYGPILTAWDTTMSGSGGRKKDEEEQESDAD